MRIVHGLTVVILSMPFPAAARAEVRTFVTEGQVTRIMDPLGTLNFTHAGARVSYRFSFETTSPDLNETRTLAQYMGLESSLTFDGLDVLAGQPFVTIQHPTDLFLVDATLTKPGFLRGQASLVLEDQVRSAALTDTSLPNVPYVLSDFAASWLNTDFDYPHPGASSPYKLEITASIESFYALPEPSGQAFFIGACALMSLRIKNKARLISPE